jgi:hypothetical protein
MLSAKLLNLIAGMASKLTYFLVAVLILAHPSVALCQYCDCLQETDEEIEARAELVVMGTVLRVEGVMDSRQEVRAYLRVDRVLKGNYAMEEVEIRTPGLVERCGIPFEEHAQWVVYARKVRNGEWYSDHCDGTKLAASVRASELDELHKATEGPNSGARYLLPGFEYVEDLVVRGEGTQAQLYRPNDDFRQRGGPFKDATLFRGDFHHNGYPLRVSVVYKSQALEPSVFLKWVAPIAGLTAEAAEMKLYKDDFEVLEYLVKRKGSDGSTGAMVSYFKQETFVVVYFLE